MARTTISVPDDLKERMEAVEEPVNWSEVAQRAFEVKLGQVAEQRKEKAMDDVVQRLKASLIEEEDEMKKAGQKAGREWVKHTASAKELERLMQHWEQFREYVYDGDSEFVANQIASVALGVPDSERCSRQQIGEFWEAVGLRGDPSLGDSDFLYSFVDGALDVWGQVADKLRY